MQFTSISFLLHSFRLIIMRQNEIIISSHLYNVLHNIGPILLGTTDFIGITYR